MFRVLGIITARGGSKGIPRKNIRLLGAKPVLQYTAEAALGAKRLARVIQELRERGLDADRARITAALDDALRRGIITSGGREHLERRLGLK